MDDFPKDFEETGLKNLGIMKKTGFLKKHGYVKNSLWKLAAVVLGILFIGVIGFIGYQISEGKFQFSANPNLYCEAQACNCPEQICSFGNITCEPPIINITINPIIT